MGQRLCQDPPGHRWLVSSPSMQVKLLSTETGRDDLDPATWDIPFDVMPDYVGACSVNGCQGLRIAVNRPRNRVCKAADANAMARFPNPFSRSPLRTPKWKRHSQGPLQRFTFLVLLLSMMMTLKTGDRAVSSETTILAMSSSEEVCANDHVCRANRLTSMTALEKFFADMEVNPHGIKNIGDLIDFTKKTPEEEYDRLGTDWFENARDAEGSSASEAFVSSKARMEEFGQDVPRLLDRT